MGDAALPQSLRRCSSGSCGGYDATTSRCLAFPRSLSSFRVTLLCVACFMLAAAECPSGADLSDPIVLADVEAARNTSGNPCIMRTRNGAGVFVVCERAAARTPQRWTTAARLISVARTMRR